MKRLALLAGTFALAAAALPAAASAQGVTYDPSEEFRLNDWIPIHAGPFDLSINKAWAYLALGSLLSIVLGIVTMRSRLALLPDRRQTVGEAVYELAQTQIAEQGLPSKAIGRWFPYVASLFLYIFVLNMVSFVPLPFMSDKFTIAGLKIPTFGIYAVTSQLSVTLILAVLSVIFTHVEGFRWNGPRYIKSFIPAGVPGPMRPIMAFLETVSHIFRIVSLSVRLYANMLAGHMLILISIGMIFILSGITFYIIVPVAFVIGIAFYLFEVVIVVTIQAFIFAALTAIYIGSAIEPEH
ncbi:MAG TPA: F0F1 ATP synthase subunit A [Gaiellaceae bacterium]|nr:F0F1 ATP synthase subunit A [Gaiellaceae bacterium]